MKKFKRILAIVLKELQDIKKNPNILIMYALPVFLTFLWHNILPVMEETVALSFGLLFLVVMVGMYVPSIMIAEEKEKNTMEVLLLSPATPLEVIIGKGLLTFLSIIMVALLLIFITGNQDGALFLIILATALTVIFAIMVGMIVGLVAKDQRSTGIIGMPVYLLLLIIPQTAGLEQGVLQRLAYLLPTYHYLLLLEKTLTAEITTALYLTGLGFILFSSLVILALLLYCYQRRGLT